MTIVTKTLAEIPVDNYQLTVESDDRGSVIRLRADDNAEPLRVEFGPAGPILYIGSSVGISVTGDLRIAARRVDVHGRDGVAFHSGANICMTCDGDLVSVAREQQICASLGDVRIEANDDVKLLGERIRLNC